MAQDPIHIKESRRGAFTRAAKAARRSVTEEEDYVLSHKDKEPARLVKEANFARNARKWHHK